MKILNIFLMWTTLNFGGGSKLKGRAGDNYKSILNTEFEQDRSFTLDATLSNREKIKKQYSSYKDFYGKIRYCRIVGVQMYNKSTKFDKNRWSHFWENENFSIFPHVNYP